MKFTVWGETYITYAEKERYVIVDFDGTLSDGKHRLHLLPTKDLHLTESWSEFNSASKHTRQSVTQSPLSMPCTTLVTL